MSYHHNKCNEKVLKIVRITKILHRHEANQCFWENYTNRLTWYGIATNLQFVKNLVSMKGNKVKCNKTRYAYILKDSGCLQEKLLWGWVVSWTSHVFPRGTLILFGRITDKMWLFRLRNWQTFFQHEPSKPGALRKTTGHICPR